LPSALRCGTLKHSTNNTLTRRLLTDAWRAPQFVATYTQWTIEILEQQRHYHHDVATRQRALLQRVHLVTSWLFGLTAVGALMHLVVHTRWLSLVTTSFPAFGASLHGALAQSEAYRLSQTSERLVTQLQGAIERIRAAVDEARPAGETAGIKASIQAAIALILEEHQDWHLLVRPHHLPLG
jgi:hypothetical protein